MTLPQNPELDIGLEAGAWADLDHMLALSREAVAATCRVGELSMVPGSEAGILLTDDNHIRMLNCEHRNQDKPTNVLSFPICDPDMPVMGPLLGDIVVAFETIENEAKAAKKPMDEHFSHLIVHGFLHLFGYDHQIEEDADAMEALETAVMSDLGYSDPYAGVDGQSLSCPDQIV